MAIAIWENVPPLKCAPCRPSIHRKDWLQTSVVCCRWQSKFLSSNFNLKRKYLFVNNSYGAFSVKLRAIAGDPGETEITDDGNPFSPGLEQAKIALCEARAKQEAVEKERDRLMEELAKLEAKQQEYADMIKHDKELALAELEAAKSLFNQKLDESVEEKFALESKLVLAKQDAIELAVQVEMLAELAFEQATSHIIEDARLRVSAAETSAAEAARRIEEQLRNTTEGTISSIVDQSKDTINKALHAAEQAISHARKAVTAITGGANFLDEIDAVRTKNIRLENTVSDLECQLLMTKNEVDRLKSELDQALAQAKTSDLRATSAEKALAELQELTKKNSFQKDETFKSLLEKIKKEAAEREKAAAKSFKSELEAISAVVEAAKETACLKDQAYTRRYAALERSLQASEAASKVWRQRAEIAESILHGEVSAEEDLNYVVNGGRIDLLTDDDSQKWKLLAEGPRREIPDWIARRIKSICPKFPPRKVDISKALSAETLSLNLPKPDEVWSIAQEKLKETDVFVEHVIEKEIIEKKRKALERALQRKTVKTQGIPEQPTLEPGTGTGREIVFQGFNWESWRRQWYLELAPKAADLSHSGITAVWLPPPTESVAPQGFGRRRTKS